jgi:hypothetical protein
MMFDLDPAEFEFPCPNCAFWNPITFGEARLGTSLICRGCKNTITPEDAMGEPENIRRRIAESVREFQKAMEGLG